MFRTKYLLFLVIPLFFFSCVDEDSMLGMGLVDQSDMLNVKKYSDFDITAYMFHEGDSLNTSNLRYMTLGTYKDLEFGEVKSSIYAQVSLSSTTMDFSSYRTGQPNQADSILLTIAYSGMFAKDTTIKEKEMKLEVFEITDDFDTVSYYTNSSLQYSPTPIVSKVIKVSPKERVVVSGDTLAPQLRVNLESDFLQKIVTSVPFPDNKSFLDFFKGIYIKLTPTDGLDNMIVYLDMFSSNSGFMLYYQDNNNKTQKYNFIFDQSTKRFTHIDYNFSGSKISAFSSNRKSSNDSISANDSIGNKSNIYLATLGITKAKLDITDLMQWYKDSTQSLGMFNQAMLIIPVDSAYAANNGTNNIPGRIICYKKNSDGKFVFINDAFTSESYMGTYDKASNSYRMRITSHLQNYLNGNFSSSEIYLIPDARISSANRVVLNGPKHATRPAKIEIIYSK
ncbi:MAG: DUF4270 family protein [Bacteroidales bacterium]